MPPPGSEEWRTPDALSIGEGPYYNAPMSFLTGHSGLRSVARGVIAAAVLVLLPFSAPAAEAQDRKSRGDYNWGLTLYRGVLTEATLGEMAQFDVSFDSDFTYLALALTKKITEITPNLNLEGEGIIVKYGGDQDHLELDALMSGRWLAFPWNRWVDTTAAFGLGLSYATEQPPYEVRNKGDSEQLLAFLLFELTVGIPRVPQWDLVARINHRSGVFGVFDGMHGAMNSLAFGLKYRF